MGKKNALLKRLHVAVLFLILIFIQIGYIASAEEEYFGFSLDCVDSCKDGKIDYSKDIIFLLTIKNNFNNWVAIEGGFDGTSLRIDVENIKLSNNGKAYEKYNIGQSVFIKPKDELKVYIPFKIYNEIDKDNRLGDWKIIPQILFGNAKFYNAPFENKEIPSYNINSKYLIKSPLIGNVLEFKTAKPEIEVQAEKPIIQIPESFWKHPLVIYLGLPIIVGVVIWLLTKRR